MSRPSSASYFLRAHTQSLPSRLLASSSTNSPSLCVQQRNDSERSTPTAPRPSPLRLHPRPITVHHCCCANAGILVGNMCRQHLILTYHARRSSTSRHQQQLISTVSSLRRPHPPSPIFPSHTPTRRLPGPPLASLIAACPLQLTIPSPTTPRHPPTTAPPSTFTFPLSCNHPTTPRLHTIMHP